MGSNQPSPRKFKLKKWAAAALLASLSLADMANAAGLGRLHVLSRIGQPFAAEIDLINVTREELASLRVSLAPPAAYQAANLPFDPALNALRLTVEQHANGTPYIRATSARRVTEPFLHLLVELTSQGGKLQRGYAALLDMPQDAAEPAAAAPAPVAAAPAPKAAVTPPRAPQSSRARKQSVAPESTPAVVPAPAAPVPAIAAARTPVTPAVAANNPVAQTESRPVEPAKSQLPEPAPPKSEPAAAEALKAEPPKPVPAEPSSVPAPEPPAPAAKKAVVPPPPPPPQRGIIDTAMNHIVLIGGIALALLVGIGGLWALRRRKQGLTQASQPIATTVDAETFESEATAGAATAASVDPTSASAAVAAAPDELTPPVATVSNVTDIVDPIDEAKVYLEHGQDEPAEDILRVALSKQPGREDMQMLLLEILAGRGDKDGFNQIAGRLHKLTGGLGGHWKRVMAMGYALDPNYPLYSPADETTAQGTLGPAAASTVIDPGSLAPAADDTSRTVDIPMDPGGTISRDMEEAEVPAQAGVEPAANAAGSLPDIDFDFPLASAPPPDDVPEKAAAATATKDDYGLDFKVDPARIDPEPDDRAATAAAPVESDPLEEVQQKIDLARAYREMGDKEAVLELLSEIEREGNAEQQAEAREILHTLE